MKEIKYSEIEIIKPNSVDPNRLFKYKNKLYRIIQNSTIQNARWKYIQEFLKSDNFKTLTELNYIPEYKAANIKLENNLNCDIYEVEKIKPCLKHNYMITQQKIDLVKLICKINSKLYELNSKFRTPDCHLGQLTFKYYNPIYLDIGSFSHKNEEGSHSKIIKFLNDYNINCKTDRTFKTYLEELNKIKINIDEGKWGKYGDALPKTKKEITKNLNQEFKLISEWLDIISNCKTITDLGCNQGNFSQLFAIKGYKILVIDNCEYALNKLYNNTKKLKLPITVALIDVNKDRSEWIEESGSDILFLSSITHHLYKQNMKWKEQVELWNKLAKKYIFVEYIDNSDIHVSKWNMENNYNMKAFEKSFSKNWNLIKKTKNSGEKGIQRYWYLFKRK